MARKHKLPSQSSSWRSQLVVIIAGIWVVVVTYSYYNPATHVWTQALPQYVPQLLPLPIVLTCTFFGLLYFSNALKGKVVHFSFNFLELLAVFWGLGVLGLLITGLTQQVISLQNVPLALLNILLKVGVVTGWLGILTAVTYVSGRCIFDIFKFKKFSSFSRFVYSVALGYMIISFSLLGLSLLGWLTSWGVVGLLMVLSVSGFTYWVRLRELLTYRFDIETSTSSLSFWSGWLVLLTAIITFSSNFLPMPNGWDTLTYYLNIVRELADTGSFVRGHIMYPVEMVYSAGYLLAQVLHLPDFSNMLVIFTAAWGGIVGVLAMILLGRQIGSLKIGLTAAAIYYTMPLITYFNQGEPKSEATRVIFGTLVLLSYVLWRESKTAKWLVMSGILFAFVFTIKYTAVFLFCALSVVYIFDVLWGKKKEVRLNAFKHLALAVLAAGIVALPWIMVHAWERNWKTSLPYGLLYGQDPLVDQRNARLARSIDGEEITFSSTGQTEDYGRYSGTEEGWWGLEEYLPDSFAQIPLERYATLFWDATMVSNLEHAYSSNMIISSLFLALVPAFGLVWFFAREKLKFFTPPQHSGVLALFSVVYLIIWSIFSWGVSWYGLSNLVVLSVIVAVIIVHSWQNQTIRYVLIVLFAVGQMLNLMMVMNRYGKPEFLRFTYGLSNQAEVTAQMLPTYPQIASVINNDPEIRAGSKYVLEVSSYASYFVNRPFHVLVNDSHLDIFSAIDTTYQHNDKRTFEALKSAGIKYVVIETRIMNNDQTREKTLQKKVMRFLEVASRHMMLREYNHDTGLLLLELI